MTYAGQDLESFILELETRKRSIYHACQLLDFESYLKLGGVPSRHHAEQHEAPLTPFDTDTVDRTNGVWDKVFFNPHDFGRTFAKGLGKDSIPTAYGPILLQFSPNALAETDDVAVCLRSAGAQGFDRSAECVPSDRVKDLFTDEGFARYGTTLTTIFEGKSLVVSPPAKDPEISCTVQKGYVSFNQLTKIHVDPYTINGRTLQEIVRAILNAHDLNRVGVYIRDRTPERDALYAELARVIQETNEPFSLDAFKQNEVLKEWAEKVRPIEYQYLRYAKYLRQGTFRLPLP